jgi:nucleoside-diphosphate-sugar epimerase
VRVLVTGGTGFTGSNLVRRLNALGMDVRLLVRDKTKAGIFKGMDIEIFQGDITDPQQVDNAVKGVEKVFHLAAVFRTAGISDKVYRDVHVKGTENLLHSSFRHGASRFVHCSTVGIHGHIDDPPANEAYRAKPGDIYQTTKLEGENKALRFCEETGLPVSVIRPCAIYGPGDMRLYKLFQIASNRYAILLGSGKIFYHMVYIDDLVDGFILASEKEKAVGEPFIIGGPEILTLNEILDLISNELGVPSTKVHMPLKPFQILGALCEKVCIPLGIEPPIYRRRVDFFAKSRAFDISKARNLLGYEPKVNIGKGLALTAAWYKANLS